MCSEVACFMIFTASLHCFLILFLSMKEKDYNILLKSPRLLAGRREINEEGLADFIIQKEPNDRDRFTNSLLFDIIYGLQKASRAVFLILQFIPRLCASIFAPTCKGKALCLDVNREMGMSDLRTYHRFHPTYLASYVFISFYDTSDGLHFRTASTGVNLLFLMYCVFYALNLKIWLHLIV